MNDPSRFGEAELQQAMPKALEERRLQPLRHASIESSVVLSRSEAQGAVRRREAGDRTGHRSSHIRTSRALDFAWLTRRPPVAACGDLSLPGRGGLGAADRADSSLAPPSDRLNHSLAVTALSLRAADPAEFGPEPAVYSRLPSRVEACRGEMRYMPPQVEHRL